VTAVATGSAPTGPRAHRRGLPGPLRTPLSVGALVLVAAGLTACLKVEQVVEVQDVDRVAVELVAEPERDFGSSRRGPDVDVRRIAGAVQAALGADSASVVDTRGGDGLRVQLETRPERLAEPIVLPGLGSIRLFERFQVTRSGDDWSVDAVALPPAAAFLPADLPAGVPATAQRELGDVDYELQLRLPGRIAGTNADEFDGDVATWRIDSGADAAPQPILVRSVPAEPVHPAVLSVGAALLAIVVGAVIIVQASEMEARRSLRRLRARTLRQAADGGDWSEVGPGTGAAERRAGRRRTRTRRRSNGGRRTTATAVVHGGMYDLGDDDSVAIPVGGNAWGPPPEPTGPATGSRSEPARISTLPGEPDGPAPGWYPDPGGSDEDRFWDGTGWTAATRPAPPPGAATPTPGPAGGHGA